MFALFEKIAGSIRGDDEKIIGPFAIVPTECDANVITGQFVYAPILNNKTARITACTIIVAVITCVFSAM